MSDKQQQGQKQPPVAVMKVALVAAGAASQAVVNTMSDEQVQGAYAKMRAQQAQGNVSDPSSRGIEGQGENDSSRSGKPGGLAGMVRKTATTAQLQAAVEALLQDSDALSEAVREQLLAMRDQLRTELGVEEAIDAKFQALMSALSDDQQAAMEKMQQWMQDVEDKVTTTLRVTLPDQPEVLIKDQHEKFADLLFNAVHRMPTLLVGPTGSGKTRAGMEVAKALRLPYSYIALGPTQTEAKLSGYPNAVGQLVPSEFYLTYRYGGVLMLDEMDAGNPSVLLWMNGAIQNKIASFPRGFLTRLEHDGFVAEAEEFKDEFQSTGGMVPMHSDTVILASANTYGKGADMMYHGRQPIDAATFKRFKFIIWDYDERLEMKIAPLDEWTRVVQAVRHCVLDKRMNHAVSTVDSIDGGKMILGGKPWQTVANETIFAGLKPDEIDKLVNDNQHRDAIGAAMTRMREWAAKFEKEQTAKADAADAKKGKEKKKKAAEEAPQEAAQ